MEGKREEEEGGRVVSGAKGYRFLSLRSSTRHGPRYCSIGVGYVHVYSFFVV